LMKS